MASGTAASRYMVLRGQAGWCPISAQVAAAVVLRKSTFGMLETSGQMLTGVSYVEKLLPVGQCGVNGSGWGSSSTRHWAASEAVPATRQPSARRAKCGYWQHIFTALGWAFGSCRLHLQCARSWPGWTWLIKVLERHPSVGHPALLCVLAQHCFPCCFPLPLP